MGQRNKPPSIASASSDSRSDVEGIASGPRQALTSGDAKFRRLFASNLLGIIVADVHGNITEANDFFLRLLGYTRDDLPLCWDVMTPPEWRELDHAKITEVLSTGEGVPWEKEYYARDGRRVPILVAVALLDEGEGDCIGLVLDLTKRRKVEERLAERRAQLQALAAELVLTEEHERRRIARGLHNDIGHALATARMKLGALLQAENSPATEESVEEIRALLDAAIEATRSLTFELSSPVLYELGLEAALKSLGKKTETEHGVRFRFETDGQPKSMAENTGIVLYRIARELLFNIVKHAHADSACLRVEREGDNFRLTLTDDGVGFDAARLGSFDKDGGFGLFNIRQQLDFIGGSIEIESSHRNGTRVVVIVPLA